MQLHLEPQSLRQLPASTSSINRCIYGCSSCSRDALPPKGPVMEEMPWQELAQQEAVSSKN